MIALVVINTNESIAYGSTVVIDILPKCFVLVRKSIFRISVSIDLDLACRNKCGAGAFGIVWLGLGLFREKVAKREYRLRLCLFIMLKGQWLVILPLYSCFAAGSILTLRPFLFANTG